MDGIARAAASQAAGAGRVGSRWLMGLEGYQLRAQLGAGPDGVAYQATAT